MPTALRPLRHRDFRLLWVGLAVSLVGGGLWLVALAWQVISLGGGPTGLSLVTALYGVGLLAFLLVGGVVADRLPQRLVMIAADLVRAAVLLVIGALSLSGDLRIWHLAVGGIVIGAGEAFFIPSYTALVPRLLPEGELLAANGLEGTLRPLAQQAAGPALGGLAVAAFSPGAAILAGGLTYLFSAGCLVAMRFRPKKNSSTSGSSETSSVFVDLREGLGYVRRTSWLWATLLFAMAFVLFIVGPLEVLLAVRGPRQPRGRGRRLRARPRRLRGRRRRGGARDLLGSAAATLPDRDAPYVGSGIPAFRRRSAWRTRCG